MIKLSIKRSLQLERENERIKKVSSISERKRRENEAHFTQFVAWIVVLRLRFTISNVALLETATELPPRIPWFPKVKRIVSVRERTVPGQRGNTPAEAPFVAKKLLIYERESEKNEANGNSIFFQPTPAVPPTFLRSFFQGLT